MDHTSLLFALAETFGPGDSNLLNLFISSALPLLSMDEGLRALQQSKTESQNSRGNSGAQSLGQPLLPENLAQPPSHGQRRCHSKDRKGFGVTCPNSWEMK